LTKTKHFLKRLSALCKMRTQICGTEKMTSTNNQKLLSKWESTLKTMTLVSHSQETSFPRCGHKCWTSTWKNTPTWLSWLLLNSA
jgi:hypothetical protein